MAQTSRAPRDSSPSGKNQQSPRLRRAQVKTRLGWLPRVGTNEWGKPLVSCPQCGRPATATGTGDVWCRECGFTTAQLAGCG